MLSAGGHIRRGFRFGRLDVPVKRLTRRQEALVTGNLDLVEPIARRVGATLAASVELDDMVQAGRIGLMQAAQRWRSDVGVPFRIYAKQRVRGAIIDAFRRRNYHYELHAELSEETTAAGAGPDELADRRIVGSLLREAMAGLSSDQRYAVAQHAEGTPYSEIGAALGRSTTWAYYRVQEGHRKLRRALAMHRLDRLDKAA